MQRAECGEAGRGQQRGRWLSGARQRSRRLVERQWRAGHGRGVPCAAHCVLNAAPRRLGVAVLLELAGDSQRGEGVAGRSGSSLRCRSARPLHVRRQDHARTARWRQGANRTLNSAELSLHKIVLFFLYGLARRDARACI